MKEEFNRCRAWSVPDTKGYTQLWLESMLYRWESVQTGSTSRILVGCCLHWSYRYSSSPKKRAYFFFMKGSEKLQLSSQCTEVTIATLGLQQCFGSRLTKTPALPASRLGHRDQELFIAAAAHWSGHTVTEAFARALQKAMQRFISSEFTFYLTVLFAPNLFLWILWVWGRL